MTGLWQPPGPVAQAFYETDEPMAGLMGPVGSGKTTVGLQRGVLVSMLQHPDVHGVRRAKGIVVRRLLKDLWATTIPSWWKWYPQAMGVWNGAKGDPASHELHLPHPADGGRVEIIVEFRAIADQTMEEALRGWEGSWGYVEEFDLCPEDAMAQIFGRLGRYRPPAEVGWRGVWGSCNAPEFDNHVALNWIEEPKEGHVLFRQPGGLDPRAENRANLPADYYEMQARLRPKHEVRRFVHNQVGISREGDPVYEEFNDDLHVSSTPIAFLPGRPVTVGLDAGGTPAAGLWQRAPNGQRRKLAELTTHEKELGSITGPNRFGEMLRELLAAVCPGAAVRGIADPSAAYGADTANGEATWIDTVARVAGITVVPARTNDPTPRREAYRLGLTRLIDGKVPALLVDGTRCRLTRKALARDYRFGKVGGPNGRRTPDPVKNWASHLIEADQYALMEDGGYAEATARAESRATAGKTFVADTRFRMFG